MKNISSQQEKFEVEQILRSQFNYLKVEDGDYVPIFERKEKIKKKKIYK